MIFLIFTIIGNIFMAIVKFVLSLTLPSFFINEIFMMVLSFARFFSISIRDYRKTKLIDYKEEIQKMLMKIIDYI